MEDVYTILEVATMLKITTQAVYKRLQLDQDSLQDYVTTKGGKRSLTKPGIEKLCVIMGLDNPFTPEDESVSVDDSTNGVTNSDAEIELLQYLRDDNKRLQEDVDSLRKELAEVRNMREEDHKTAEAERRQHEEARMRADTLLMKAMMNQEKPRLLERIFGKKKEKTTEPVDN